ncbi:hypothetical protein WR25_20822 [Diploscapter pachys]|uniref:Uncharacterized protein n=1 Tax=Diploscapter pachys TaxID=2018661 RepID=A0A2A2LE55_9BILA|nr:hypothetical protein WR25_20822 [Diploscapter pachys]
MQSVWNRTFVAEVVGFHTPILMRDKKKLMNVFIGIEDKVYRVAVKGDLIKEHVSSIRKKSVFLFRGFSVSTLFLNSEAWRPPNLDPNKEFCSVAGEQIKSTLTLLHPGISVFSNDYVCCRYPPFAESFKSMKTDQKYIRVKCVVMAKAIKIERGEEHIDEIAVQVGIQDDHSMGFVIYQPAPGGIIKAETTRYFAELEPGEEIVVINGVAGIHEGKRSVIISDLDHIDLTPVDMQSMKLTEEESFEFVPVNSTEPERKRKRSLLF